MSEKLYLYPIWLRIWHGINALMIIVLILTGVSMQYSNPDHPFIRFDLAVTWHNIAGVVLTIGYLVFVVGNLTTKNGLFYRMKLRGLFDRLMKQARYYLYGVFKGEPVPFPINKFRKFNPLQQLAYAFVMYLFFPILFITGWALLFPEIIWMKVYGYSGILLTAILHIFGGFVVSIFLFVHLYFCTFGKTAISNFSSMINGYHEPH
jgi:thiosulfate reductase cytochrome b subunit